MSELLVEVWRGQMVESLHRGDVAVVDSHGNLLYYAGDPQRVTYARSSAKPLQALPMVESGAVDSFHMTDEEIALACASHSGEEQHVLRILAFLSRIGIPPEKLRCGTHAPYSQPAFELLLKRGEEYTAIHNNCSGKHSGMLAFAKFLNADLDSYLLLEHPIQQRILQVVSEMSEVNKDQIELGVDGCGVPVFGLPVQNLALAFAKLADPSELQPDRATAVRRIVTAMMKYPHLVAGTERFCTGLMEAGQGQVLGKAGAEGVYCAGIPAEGIGICVKVDDGNSRAAYPVVVETLRQLSLVSEEALAALEGFRNPILQNHQGTVVGELKPVFTLHKA